MRCCCVPLSVKRRCSFSDAGIGRLTRISLSIQEKVGADWHRQDGRMRSWIDYKTCASSEVEKDQKFLFWKPWKVRCSVCAVFPVMTSCRVKRYLFLFDSPTRLPERERERAREAFESGQCRFKGQHRNGSVHEPNVDANTKETQKSRKVKQIALQSIDIIHRTIMILDVFGVFIPQTFSPVHASSRLHLQ